MLKCTSEKENGMVYFSYLNIIMNPLKFKPTLLKLYKMNILKDTGEVLLDNWNSRVLLESLTSQENKNLAFEVNQLMMKYPPTMERHYYITKLQS